MPSRNPALILTLVDPRREALAAIRACKTLDAVLALDSPARLVARLFGDNASKTLFDPLSEALLRGLMNRDEHGVLSYGSIALASAASGILDAGRLATVLSWDDCGLDIAPVDAPEDFAADLHVVIGHYRDPRRRLKLLDSLWQDVCKRALRTRSEGQFVAEVMSQAKGATKNAQRYVRESFNNAKLTKTTNDAAAMIFEWHVHRFVMAEHRMVVAAAHDRSVDLTTADWLRGTGPKKTKPSLRVGLAVELVVSAAQLREAVKLVLPSLPKAHERRGRTTLETPNVQHAYFSRRINEQIESLLRFAAGDQHGDIDNLPWLNYGSVYRGAHAELLLKRDPGSIPPSPKPALTLPAAVAQVAQLVRLGATLPAKPTSWTQLLLDVCEPYYVHNVLAIDCPDWIRDLHGREIPGTGLTIKIPRDMAELCRWADHMGNCIHSIHGDDVSEGKTIILGLFSKEELMYNAGVASTSRYLWEVNSRFNNGEVPAEIEPALAALIAALPRADATPPALRGPRVPKARSGRKTPKFTPEIRSAIDEIATELAQTSWSPEADLLTLCQGHHLALIKPKRGHWSWIATTTALQRIDDAIVAADFHTRTENVELANFWDLATTHPLDDVLARLESEDRRSIFLRNNARLLSSLQFIRNGDDRAQLAQTERLLDNPILDAAWQLGRLQHVFAAELRKFVTESPRKFAPALRAEQSRNAGFGFSLLFCAHTITNPDLLQRRDALVPFAFRNQEHAQQTWQAATRIDPDAIATLTREFNLTAENANEIQSLFVHQGQPIPHCPHLWLNATR
jgi:hypothetical protein